MCLSDQGVPLVKENELLSLSSEIGNITKRMKDFSMKCCIVVKQFSPFVLDVVAEDICHVQFLQLEECFA